MNLQDKKVIEDIIKVEISSIKTELFTIKTQLGPVEKVCSLDGSYHEGLYQEQTVLMQSYQKYTKRLNKLIVTLDTVKSESYGICRECKEDISIERLKLLPESIYCVSCMNELGL